MTRPASRDVLILMKKNMAALKVEARRKDFF
jgi:hypothetical protein